MYTVWRNQHKFEKRCTSKRHAVSTDVFRLDTVELMVDARQRLVRLDSKIVDSLQYFSYESILYYYRRSSRRARRNFGTQKVNPSGPIERFLGWERFGLHVVCVQSFESMYRTSFQNYMTESARRKAISTYTRYIQLFALRCLAERSFTEGVRVDLCASDLPAAAPSALTLATSPAGTDLIRIPRCYLLHHLCCADKEVWRRQAELLAMEFKSTADIAGLLSLYREMLGQEAERARIAKSKDSARGAAIIPDYDQVHPSADRDSVVLWMKGIATGNAKAKL